LRRSNGLLPILDSRISFRVVPVDDCVEEPVSQRRCSSTTKRTLVGAWIISMRQISPSKRRDQPLQRPEGWMDSFAGNCSRMLSSGYETTARGNTFVQPWQNLPSGATTQSLGADPPDGRVSSRATDRLKFRG